MIDRRTLIQSIPLAAVATGTVKPATAHTVEEGELLKAIGAQIKALGDTAVPHGSTGTRVNYVVVRKAKLEALLCSAGQILDPNTCQVADPHAEWVSEHKVILDRVFAPEAPDLESDNSDWVRAKEIERRICETPATTPQGAAAQLAFAMSDEANFDMTGGVAGDLDGQILRNILATLKSLT